MFLLLSKVDNPLQSSVFSSLWSTALCKPIPHWLSARLYSLIFRTSSSTFKPITCHRVLLLALLSIHVA